MRRQCDEKPLESVVRSQIKSVRQKETECLSRAVTDVKFTLRTVEEIASSTIKEMTRLLNKQKKVNSEQVALLESELDKKQTENDKLQEEVRELKKNMTVIDEKNQNLIAQVAQLKMLRQEENECLSRAVNELQSTQEEMKRELHELQMNEVRLYEQIRSSTNEETFYDAESGDHDEETFYDAGDYDEETFYDAVSGDHDEEICYDAVSGDQSDDTVSDSKGHVSLSPPESPASLSQNFLDGCAKFMWEVGLPVAVTIVVLGLDFNCLMDCANGLLKY